MNVANFPNNLGDGYSNDIVYAEKPIKLKTYISESEALDIIQQCIDVYDNGATASDGELVKDEIIGFDKNIWTMEIFFNRLVVQACTDLVEYDYDVLVASGFLDYLSERILNYNSLLKKIYFIIGQRDSLPNVVEKALKSLVEKIPNAKELDKLYSKVKKDLTSEKIGQIIERFKSITDIQTK